MKGRFSAMMINVQSREKSAEKRCFSQFLVSFLPVLGGVFGSFGSSLEYRTEEELFGFQVFDKRNGTVGQLGQLKISIPQNAKNSTMSI